MSFDSPYSVSYNEQGFLNTGKRANYTIFPDQRILSRLRAKLTHGV